MQSSQLIHTFFFFSNICRLKTQVKRNIFLTNFLQCHSHNDFLTTSFSQCLSLNVFLTTSLSKLLCHTVSLTYSSTQRSPHNVTIYALSFCAVQVSLTSLPQIESSEPRHFDNFWPIKLKPRRCISEMCILSLCEVSEP